MIAALVGLILPIAGAWWVLQALRLRPAIDSRLTAAAVACCLGLGASSILTFVAVSLGAFPGTPFVVADAALWLLVAGFARRQARRRPAGAPPLVAAPTQGEVPAPLRLALLAVVMVAFAVPVIEYLAAPHGQWDAWAIWNQKARFFVRGGPEWTGTLLLPWAQPGHPVFVSLTVARLWAYAGGEPTAVPALLSAVYGAAALAVVMGTLDVTRSRAWIAGMILVAPFAFSHLVAAQTADLPLSMLVVASLAMLRQDDPGVWRDARRARSSLVVAGALAGLAAWTKNEGAVFVAASALLVLWIVVRHGRMRDGLWWLAGAAPILAVAAWFKLVVAAAAAPVYGPATLSAAVELLTSPDRQARVAALVAPFWVDWGGPMARGSLPVVMGAAIVLALTPVGRSGRGVLMVVAIMLACDYLVYLVTSMDLAWLVATTFERLTMQVWPALVLAALSVGEPAIAAQPWPAGGTR